jgi:uncharacterized delta-60 repeat protein
MKYLHFLNNIILLIATSVLTIFFQPSALFSQQAGTRDESFGNNGVVYCAPDYGSSEVLLSLMDAQERILTISYAGNDSTLVLVRNLIDGSLDPAFGNNGQAILAMDRRFGTGDLVIQEDGKLLITGELQHLPDTSWTNSSDLFVARLLQDGSPDTTFAEQGRLIIDLGQDEYGSRLILQEDDKLLISGNTGKILLGGGNTDVLLIRLLSDGTPDNSFGVAGIAVNDLSESGYDIDFGGPMVIQPDGKIVMAAINGTWYNGVGYFARMRYETSGVLDTSFGDNGIIIDEWSDTPFSTDIALTNDLALLVAGRGGQVFTGGYYLTLRKYTPEGLPDSTFAENGLYSSEPFDNYRCINSIAVQSDHKIVAAGVMDDKLLLMRFTPEGQPDSTFASQGIVLDQFDSLYCSAGKIYLYPEDRITLLGTASHLMDTSKVLIARYHNSIGTAVASGPIRDQLSLKIYPNPSSGNFRIEYLAGNSGKPTLLKMMNLQGQLVFTRPLHPGDQELNVQLPPGIYLLSVASGNGTQTELITIQ